MGKLRIEFPSAFPADVTGPQALDLRADAPALPGAPYAQNNAHVPLVYLLGHGCQLYANNYPFDFSLFSNEGRSEFIYLRVY